jgi:hypothetical protein
LLHEALLTFRDAGHASPLVTDKLYKSLLFVKPTDCIKFARCAFADHRFMACAAVTDSP